MSGLLRSAARILQPSGFAGPGGGTASAPGRNAPPRRSPGFILLYAVDANRAGSDGIEPEGNPIFTNSGVLLGATGGGGDQSFGTAYRH